MINSDLALCIYRLSNSQNINIQILGTTTILMIANVTDEDYGNYTCVASNRLGVQNASLFLYSKYTFIYSALSTVGVAPSGLISHLVVLTQQMGMELNEQWSGE